MRSLPLYAACYYAKGFMSLPAFLQDTKNKSVTRVARTFVDIAAHQHKIQQSARQREEGGVVALREGFAYFVSEGINPRERMFGDEASGGKSVLRATQLGKIQKLYAHVVFVLVILVGKLKTVLTQQLAHLERGLATPKEQCNSATVQNLAKT